MSRNVQENESGFEIGVRVESVYRRRLAQRIARRALTGAGLGGLLFLCFFLLSLAMKRFSGTCLGGMGDGGSTLNGLIAFGVGGILGGIAGFWRHPSRREAASLIDRFYDGKDRVLTAWEGEKSKNPPSPMAILQYADAFRLTEGVRPAEILPFRWPRGILVLGILGVLGGICPFFLGNGSPNAEKDSSLLAKSQKNIPETESRGEIKANFPKGIEGKKKGEGTFSSEQNKIFAELESLEKRLPSEASIRDPLETLRRQAKDFQARQEKSQNNEDRRRDDLALYSEASELLRGGRENLNLDAMEDGIERWADFLETHPMTRPAGEAFRQGNFKEAASQWGEIAWNRADKATREGLGEDLRESAERWRALGEVSFAADLETLAGKLTREQTDLSSEPASESGSDLTLPNKNRESADFKTLTEKIASQIVELGEKYASRLRTAQAIDEEINRLEREKAKFSSSSGLLASSANPSRHSSKTEGRWSAGDSERWGGGSIGDPRTGPERSALPPNGEQWVISARSEGSDSGETIILGETSGTKERAAAKNREIDVDFQKMPETPLPSYPIPWSRRDVVRRYFESIHSGLQETLKENDEK